MRFQVLRAAAACLCVTLGAPVSAGPLGVLPPDVSHDPAVPSPARVLGFEVGSRHVRHDELVRYMRTLAETSPRVALQETGRTHEGRPLLLLAVSSPANIADLENVRQRHLREGETGVLADDPAAPLVVWQGFSVHGNEPSGANASLLLAWHLAAGDGPVEERLADTVVLIDPALNPDGLARFAQWANGHKGVVPVADPAHREHHEAWPGGRTNHYWFDLNRDWLLLTHPESRARVEQFHRWRPHVLTDFHEMGSDATYFFQPGVPDRRHPLIPPGNEELTRRIAGYHARAMDRAGRLYYTEETFDDFYYGKGSTYPDINGTVGILFEQASSRGHVMATVHGELEFPTTVANQLRLSLSTLEAADDMREDLRRWQADFWKSARADAADRGTAAYVIGDGGDPARARKLLDVLLRHRIEVHALGADLEVDGRTFRAGHAWVVPLVQDQYRLVEALMERRTAFESETFYDVSAWSFPDAFNLPVATSRRLRPETLGARLTAAPPAAGRFAPHDDAVAYAFDWAGADAPRALQRLLAGAFAAYAATEPLTVATPGGEVDLGRGAILLPLGLQAHRRPAAPGTPAAGRPPEDRRADLEEALGVVAASDGVTVHAVLGGLTPGGPDLGSPRVRRLEPVRPLLVVGPGVRGTEAGEVWHLLDTRVGLPLTLVDGDRLEKLDLRGYTHIVLVDGRYSEYDEAWPPKLRAWVEAGGVLVATKRAARWVTEQGLHLPPEDSEDRPPAEPEEAAPGAGKPDRTSSRRSTAPGTDADADGDEKDDADRFRPYDRFRDDLAHRRIGGAIFRVTLDTTHPLGFGYAGPSLPVFRNSTKVLEPGDNPYTTVARYADDARVAGFVSDTRLEEIRGTAAIVAERVGGGAVIRMADNPNFRGVWYGTAKLFLNALYFGRLIEPTRLDDDER